MTMTHWSCTRRGFLRGLAVGAVAFSMPGAFAEALVWTPLGTKGTGHIWRGSWLISLDLIFHSWRAEHRVRDEAGKCGGVTR